MPRLPLVPIDTDDPTVREVFATFEREQREPIALYRTLAHAPWLLSAYSGLARALRYEATTPRSLRELMILASAKRIGSEYEWSHHHSLALKAGVSPEQIAAIGDWRTNDLFDETQRAALRCAEEISDHALSKEAYDALAAHFSEAEVVELIVICSFYEAVARMIQGLGIEVEPEYIPYLTGLDTSD